MIFPVVTYDCESWAVKKAECQRIDTFELWCWRKLLKVPWPARRLNQSILREIKLAYSLERLKLKLKLHYSDHLIQTDDSLENSLMLGKIEGRRRGCQKMRWMGYHRCNEHELGQTLGDGEGQGGLVCCSPWGHKELDMTGQLNNNNNIWNHLMYKALEWYYVGVRVCKNLKILFNQQIDVLHCNCLGIWKAILFPKHLPFMRICHTGLCHATPPITLLIKWPCREADLPTLAVLGAPHPLYSLI